MEIGTSCRRSSIRRAVTMTSSNASWANTGANSVKFRVTVPRSTDPLIHLFIERNPLLYRSSNTEPRFLIEQRFVTADLDGHDVAGVFAVERRMEGAQFLLKPGRQRGQVVSLDLVGGDIRPQLPSRYLAAQDFEPPRGLDLRNLPEGRHVHLVIPTIERFLITRTLSGPVQRKQQIFRHQLTPSIGSDDSLSDGV